MCRPALFLLPALLIVAACETAGPRGDAYYGDPHPDYPVYPGYPVYSPYYPYGIRVYPDERPDINSRLRQVEKSIEKGVAQGTLSVTEEQSLRQELNTLQQKADKMKGDGTLSPAERNSLNSDLNKLQRHIQQEKRDSEKRSKKQR